MQTSTETRRIVTIRISSEISAQGVFLGEDAAGKAIVNTGKDVLKGKLISEHSMEVSH